MTNIARSGRGGTVLRRGLFAFGVALLATVAVATPAMAGPKPPTPPRQPAGIPGGFTSWAQLSAVQAKLDAAGNRIVAAGGAGYAGIVVVPEKRELRVYWKGAVPASVSGLAAGLGVSVTFLPARFTQRELVAEAQRVAADARVATASPKADGSGLAVTVTSSVRPANQPDILGSTSIPVSVTAGQRPQGMFSRQADTPLFWGGSRYFSPVGGCSNGFALSVAGAANIYEISAGHCGNNSDAVSIPGQPSPTGSVLAKAASRDTLAINYPAGVAGRVYTGPFDSSSSAAVGGATADFVGDFICTSGSSSGEHCTVQVLGVDEFVNTNVGVLGPETRGFEINSGCAVAPGDSGGPAYSYRSDGRVDGRGTISAGILGNASCPGVSPSGSSTVWYAPLLRPAGDPQIGSLQFYGVGILTG